MQANKKYPPVPPCVDGEWQAPQGKAKVKCKAQPKWPPWKKMAPTQQEASANMRQAASLDAMQTAADMAVTTFIAHGQDMELGFPSPTISQAIAKAATRVVDVAAKAAASAREVWSQGWSQDWSQHPWGNGPDDHGWTALMA